MKKFHGDIQTEAQLQARWAALDLPVNLHGKRVLDIGAAEGWFSRKCHEAGAEVTAVEPVRRMLGYLRWFKVYFDEPFLVSVEENELLESTDEYDLILMLRVLYHMKIPQLALERAFRLLKPGGQLYIESWFDDPTDSRSMMRMYIDAPDGWRFVPTRECLYDMLIKYGFTAPECIFKYQDNHRQIWRTSRNIE